MGDRSSRGSSPSRISSRGHPSRASSPALPTNTHASSKGGRHASSLRDEDNSSLITDIASHSNSNGQEKHGLAITRRKRRFSYNKITALYQGGWTAETCSVIIALISLLALVTTLLVHQDRPLPKWPSFITINALVSIFTSVFRSGIAMALAEGISQSKWHWFRQPRKLSDMNDFDCASRGPWGSLLLLLSFRITRKYYVAAVGALLTVLITAAGFFSQQILLFKDCMESSLVDRASIAKTNNFNQSGTTYAPFFYDVYFPLAAAINVGILQNQTDYTPVLSHGCSTGDCFFRSDNGSTFSTVAVNSSCTLITDQINYDSSQNRDQAIFKLPTSVGLFSDSVEFEGDDDVVLVTATQLSQDPRDIQSLKFMFRNYSVEGDDAWRRPQAVSCSLYPTYNTYHTGVRKGFLKETLISSTRIGPNIFEEKDEVMTMWKLATKTTLRNGAWETCLAKKEKQSGFTRVASGNIDAAPNHSIWENIDDKDKQEWWYPDDCVWSMGRAASVGIRRYFEEIFMNQKQIWRNNGPIGGTVHLRQLYNEGDMSLQSIQEAMDRLTTSMTAVIRSHGSEGEAWHVQGDVQVSTTCVKVRWGWITFPSCMIILTVIFLVLVSHENRDMPSNRLWKSSILAALFSDVDATAKPAGCANTDLREKAKSTAVQIHEDGQRIRFVVR